MIYYVISLFIQYIVKKINSQLFVQNPKLLAAAELVVHLNLPLLPTSRELWFGMLPIWDADAFGGVATRQSNSVSGCDDFEAARLSKLISRPWRLFFFSQYPTWCCLFQFRLPQAWVSHLHWGSCICLSCKCQYAFKIIESFKGCEVLGWICDLHWSRLQQKTPPAAILISGVLVFSIFCANVAPAKWKWLFADRFSRISLCLVLLHGHGGDDCVRGTMAW